MDEPAPETTEEKGKKGGSKKSLPIAIIALAVPLCVWMLLDDSTPPNEAEKEKRVAFSEVIKKLELSPTDQERGPQSLRATLQQARSDEMRGETGDAQKAYLYVRDTLIRHRMPDGKFRDPEDGLVWEYVKQRLNALFGEEIGS